MPEGPSQPERTELQSFSTGRKLALASLGALSAILLGLFLYVYYSGEDDSLAELTAPSSPLVESESSPAAQSNGGAASGETLEDSNVQEAAPLRVYVAGAVRRPGVYEMGAGDRLVDAVDAAGGASQQADLEAVNLARRIEDEGYYYIPVKVSPQEPSGEPAAAESETGTDGRFPPLSVQFASQRPSETAGEAEAQDDGPAGPVNLNTATQSELESLPGIGPARSRAIIAFREQNGPFVAVEEITAVSGIGQGILDSLQGLVTVEENP